MRGGENGTRMDRAIRALPLFVDASLCSSHAISPFRWSLRFFLAPFSILAGNPPDFQRDRAPSLLFSSFCTILDRCYSKLFPKDVVERRAKEEKKSDFTQLGDSAAAACQKAPGTKTLKRYRDTRGLGVSAL